MRLTGHFRYILTAIVLTGCLAWGRAASEPTDTLLSRLYNRAATLMEEGAYASAEVCFDQAFATKGVKESPLYPILLNEQGTLYFYTGELARSLETKKSVLPYLPEVDDLEKHVSVYNDLGVLYHRFNRQDSSLYYYNKAVDAARAYGDKSWLANLSLNIGVFNFNLKHYENAEQCIDEALKYVLQTDDTQMTFTVWQVRAAIKAQTGKLDEAGESIQEAWKMACGPEGNAEWKVRCIPGIYRYFQRTGQTDSIPYYINIGNRLLKELPPYNVSAIGFIQTQALANYEQQRYAEALEDFVYLYTHPTGSEKKSLFEKMAVCYHHTGQAQKAFAYMDSARIWADSLARQEITTQLAEMKVKYETQEKELEIAQLQQKVLTQEANGLRTAIAILIGMAVIVFILSIQRQRQKAAERKLLLMKREKELESAQSYIEGLEEECRYFAKELHDGIANDLFALEMKSANSHNEELGKAIKRLRENIRFLSHELMPPEFEHLSLSEILQKYAASLAESTGIRIRYTDTTTTGQPVKLSDRTARELYRIVQEITTNIVKHAQASDIEIRFGQQADGSFRLQIADDGQPWEPQPQRDMPKGIGLRTVNDRAKAICAVIENSQTENKNLFTLTFNTNAS